MGFRAAVTLISERPLETPAACRVHLAETTLKPSESVAEYRIQLPLPYILQSTPLLGTTGKSMPVAKAVLREADDVVRAQVRRGV